MIVIKVLCVNSLYIISGNFVDPVLISYKHSNVIEQPLLVKIVEILLV